MVGVAHHSETGEALVVYKALYCTEYGSESLWVRPLSMFREKIEYRGKMVERFSYIS